MENSNKDNKNNEVATTSSEKAKVDKYFQLELWNLWQYMQEGDEPECTHVKEASNNSTAGCQ